MRKPQRLFIRPPAPTFPWWAKLAAGLLLVVVSLPLAPKPAIAPAPSRAQLAMQLLAPLPAEARHDPAPPPRLSLSEY
jgi:hypothetical protein